MNQEISGLFEQAFVLKYARAFSKLAERIWRIRRLVQKSQNPPINLIKKRIIRRGSVLKVPTSEERQLGSTCPFPPASDT
jgi:hypothetical protein